MGTLNPPASGVTVRMYRQGLGDCFLLAFPTGQPGQAFYMLIDCGVIFGTQNATSKMQDVATDIEAATGGDIHLWPPPIAVRAWPAPIYRIPGPRSRPSATLPAK